MTTSRRILVTGGAGYIGSVLVPKLLSRGHAVTVLDCLFFGRVSLRDVESHPRFDLYAGDIRDRSLVERVLSKTRCDTVIHLAAISNDPCSDLEPELTRSVNFTAVCSLMEAAKRNGVSRFIYASSASVYGVKSDPEVHEDLPLQPITLYARYKAEGEAILNALVDHDFCGVSVRAATVCGYSPRLRLDLTINILTHHALRQGRIRVFGGEQMRPNVHVEDLTDFYTQLITADGAQINGRAFNVSAGNATVLELAEMVRREIDPALPIVIEPTEDRRSYHLSARRVRAVLGFEAATPLQRAVRDLRDALLEGRVSDPEASIYRNVEHMKRYPELWRFERKAVGT